MRRSLPLLPFLAVFCCLTHVASAKIDHQHGKHDDKSTKHRAEATAPKHGDEIDARKSYTELFKAKRRDQLGAIESIVNIEEYKRRHYVEEVVKNVKAILDEHRETLERIGHRASEPFPHGSETLSTAISKVVEVKIFTTILSPQLDTMGDSGQEFYIEGLSAIVRITGSPSSLSKDLTILLVLKNFLVVLENIAFFADLSLRFPFLEKTLQKNQKLRTVVAWAYRYAKGTGLCDAETYKVLDMMAQQQGIIPKSESFVNPYDKEGAKKELDRIAQEEQQRRAKEKSKDVKMTKDKKSSSKSEL
ncbi:unnamed protein product [Heligmosomoides polygyrus]|uniref:Coiled-coil domain-containing protein 134 n=1 Tax=Heligmosomoides polygyrus TaxID=6339 RepID=A0A3P8E3C6_HELPZ|nr:unnamed protein product [Heligmosomoides polygyrus]